MTSTIYDKIENLKRRVKAAMMEAEMEGLDPYDGHVYLAGRSDCYVGHVIRVLEDLGIRMDNE